MLLLLVLLLILVPLLLLLLMLLLRLLLLLLITPTHTRTATLTLLPLLLLLLLVLLLLLNYDGAQAPGCFYDPLLSGPFPRSPGTHIVGPWVIESIHLHKDLRTGTQYVGNWASRVCFELHAWSFMGNGNYSNLCFQGTHHGFA